jgi:signal transduction histidine kinase
MRTLSSARGIVQRVVGRSRVFLSAEVEKTTRVVITVPLLAFAATVAGELRTGAIPFVATFAAAVWTLWAKRPITGATVASAAYAVTLGDASPLRGVAAALVILVIALRLPTVLASILAAPLAIATILWVHPPDGSRSAIIAAPLTLAWALGVAIQSNNRARAQAIQLSEDLRVKSARLMRALETAEQVATMRERARIALDLHDELGHHLTAVHLMLERAYRTTDGSAKLERVGQARLGVENALGTLRRTVRALRERRTTVLASVQEACEAAPLLGIDVELTAQESFACGSELGHAVAQGVREVLTNVAKHSHARTVEIALRRAEGGVEVTLTDGGPRKLSETGELRGLAGIRERFQDLGEVRHASVGLGFRVTLRAAGEALER